MDKHTFKFLELELDKRLDSTPVHYITGTDAREEEIIGVFFGEKLLSLVEAEDKQGD